MSESLADLMGINNSQLLAFLYIYNASIVGEAAIYKYMVANGIAISWKPECININIVYEYSCHNINCEMLCLVMMRLGYYNVMIRYDANKIKNEEGQIYEFHKNDKLPVIISVYNNISYPIRYKKSELEKISYIANDLSDKYRFVNKGGDDYPANLLNHCIVIDSNDVDASIIERYKSRGFKIFTQI
jgi:hypothetical protein